MDKGDMIIVFKIPHSFLKSVQYRNFFLYFAGVLPETEERTNYPWSTQAHHQPKGNEYVDRPDCWSSYSYNCDGFQEKIQKPALKDLTKWSPKS